MRTPGMLFALVSSLSFACSSTFQYQPADAGQDGADAPEATVPSNVVVGTVGGKSMSVAESMYGNATINGGSDQELAIYLTSGSGVCSALGSNTRPRGETSLLVELRDFNGTGYQFPTAGTFSVWDGVTMPPPSKAAIVTFRAIDTSCGNTVANATKGTIDVQQTGTGGWSGSGTVELQVVGMATTDNLSVSFTATSICDAVNVVVNGSATCSP